MNFISGKCSSNLVAASLKFQRSLLNMENHWVVEIILKKLG